MDLELLENCGYEARVFDSIKAALEGLHDEKDGLEFYISNENGVEKMENVSVVDDVPVIMVSKGSETSRRGVCICIVKPIKISELWRIVYQCIRENRSVAKDIEVDVINQSTEKRQKKNDEIIKCEGNKKKRIQWSSELHQKFLMALQQQGIDTTPKRILEFMAVPGLKRQHVGSHLQKYRKSLKEDNSNVLLPIDIPNDTLEVPLHFHAPNNHNSFNGLSTTSIDQNPPNHSPFQRKFEATYMPLPLPSTIPSTYHVHELPQVPMSQLPSLPSSIFPNQNTPETHEAEQRYWKTHDEVDSCIHRFLYGPGVSSDLMSIFSKQKGPYEE